MDPIARRALELIAENGHGVAARLSAEFNITRQAASGRIQRMVRDGLLISKD